MLLEFRIPPVFVLASKTYTGEHVEQDLRECVLKPLPVDECPYETPNVFFIDMSLVLVLLLKLMLLILNQLNLILFFIMLWTFLINGTVFTLRGVWIKP